MSPGLSDPKIKRFYDVSEKVKARYGLSIRGANVSDFEKEVALLFGLYNDTWQKNWGFVPVNQAEFRQIAIDLEQIVVGDLVLIVEDRAGKPVAFSVTLPNVNEIMPKNGRLFPFAWWRLLTGMKRIKTARLFVLGVAPGHRKHGVEAMLCIETALRANRLGYSSGEIGWTLGQSAGQSRGGGFWRPPRSSLPPVRARALTWMLPRFSATCVALAATGSSAGARPAC